MLKRVAFLFMLLVQVFTLGALEVAVEEVNKARNHQSIVFQNFTGVHQDNDTAEQIRNLGRALASMSTQENRLYTISNKYSVVEVTNNENDNLYSVAVISIDPAARVDHIRNVRQIVAGYLESKFNYSTRDADTLAFFLSFYNAIYRGDVAYLRTVYKPEIFEFLNADNAGISTNYQNWPGKTRLIIPLTAASGVSLAHLGQETIASAKENEENMAIEQRENLQELKSQQLEEKKQQQAQEKDKDEELQIILDQKESESIAAREEAAKKQAEAQRLQVEANAAVASGAPDAQEKVAAAQAAETAAQAAQQQADQKTEEVAQVQKDIEKQEQTKTQTQQEIEQLAQDTEKEQQQLAEDKAAQAAQQQAEEQAAQQEQQQPQEEQQPQQQQQTETEKLTQEAIENPGKVAQELANAREELENRPTGPVVADKFFYMSVSNRQSAGHYNNRLFAIDASTGQVLGSSQPNICSVNFTAYAGGVLVVTSRDATHAGPHNLSILSLNTLTPVKETDASVDVHWNSPVVLNGGKIYALTVQNNSVFLARFNENLDLEVQTQTPVDGDTSITVYKDHVYANMTGQNKIVVFNKSDLSTISEIAIPN